MNELRDQPFAESLQELNAINFNEVQPLAKLWALRILVELGGCREFISDNSLVSLKF